MSAIEVMDDPYEVMMNVRERLVLSFELSRERRRFTLVCDYPVTAPGARCAFAAFVFEDVREFAREKGMMTDSWRFDEQFDARVLTMPVVIESIKSISMADELHLDLWFGYSFGGVQFIYSSAKACRRNALARQVGEGWLCRDMDSQEEYDFYEPFPDLMNGAGTPELATMAASQEGDAPAHG